MSDKEKKKEEKVEINNQTDSHEEEKNKEYISSVSFEGEAYNKNPEKRTAPILTDEAYLKNRVEDQHNWYDKKASDNQKKYKKLKKWEFILAASIPVIISFSAMGIVENTNIFTKMVIEEGVQKSVSLLSLSGIFQIIAASAGIVLVVINKVLELENYQKNWMEYRAMAESLERERLLYITRTEPYDESNAFPLFVEHIEGLLAKEVQKWKSVPKQQQNNELLEKAQKAIDNNLNTKSE